MMTGHNTTNEEQSGEDFPKGAITDPDELIKDEPLIEVFGKPGSIKIMRTLIDGMGAPLPVSDIAEQSGIDTQTFYNNEELLIEYELIERVDKIGNAMRYRAKMESEPVQALMHLYDALLGIED